MEGQERDQELQDRDFLSEKVCAADCLGGVIEVEVLDGRQELVFRAIEAVLIT